MLGRLKLVRQPLKEQPPGPKVDLEVGGGKVCQQARELLVQDEGDQRLEHGAHELAWAARPSAI